MGKSSACGNRRVAQVIPNISGQAFKYHPTGNDPTTQTLTSLSPFFRPDSLRSSSSRSDIRFADAMSNSLGDADRRTKGGDPPHQFSHLPSPLSKTPHPAAVAAAVRNRSGCENSETELETGDGGCSAGRMYRSRLQGKAVHLYLKKTIRPIAVFAHPWTIAAEVLRYCSSSADHPTKYRSTIMTRR